MKGTIRQRGRDTWQLVYDLPPGPDGKRKQKTETVRGPKKAAQIRLRELLGAVDQGRVADPGKMTLGQYMDDWLAGLDRAGSTLERYESIIRLSIKPNLGHIKLSAITALHIETFYRTQREKLSGATVRLFHAILSKSLGRAMKLGLIIRNPCADVEAIPKADKKAVRFLTPEQKHRFIMATEGSPYRPMIMTALATGMRLSELRGLHWKDVDLKAGVIHVRHSADRHDVIIDHMKSKASRRSITIPPVLVEILQDHHRHLLEEKMRLRPIWQDLGLVFPRADGSVLGIRQLNRPLKRLADKAEVDVHFHGLRHTHASDLIAAGVHAKVISERLGHSSIVITLDRYGHLFPGSQDQAAAAIDAMLRASM